MSHDCCHDKGHELEHLAHHKDIRRVLVIVLMLNAMMFLVEFGAGLFARSAALMADSVDMLGDAMVFGISLYALGRSLRWRAGAALIKGSFILFLGVGVLGEIVVKLIWGVVPVSSIMLTVGGMALVANLSCLALLWPYRTHDVNLSSTFECARNDTIANLGVLAAAGLVSLSASAWPDIVVAIAIAYLFLRSSLRVIAEAWPQYRSTMQPAA
ncbi:MAG TPA: cation transporter [Allosphingosinicella sp.]|jgi:Co/Zn/Cd efflux system component|nr:cation transporter [Allosphingosinicella sp.]